MNFKCVYKELVSVKDLRPHPKNTNKHTKEQIERLAKLIEYQGQRSSLVVSTRSGFIVKGHATLQAIKKLKWASAAVDYQDFDSDDQELAYLTSDNAIASWASLDMGMINDQLKDLGPDFDIEWLGLESFGLDGPEVEHCDPDDAPEPKAEARTVLGDLYELGGHRLLCGDSTSIDAVEKLMGGQKADMVFTDPPYGYKYESNHQRKHKMLENDDKILDFLPLAFASMNENSGIYVCGSHQTICDWKPLVETNFKYKNLIVWKKNNWSMGDLSGAYAGQHELIIFAHKGKVLLNGDRDRDVWEFDRDPPKEHPTQKPVDLIEFAIQKTSNDQDVVLDFFGGSGSTLIACEKTNRKCFMMELDPKYCDVIVSRFCKYTGTTKVKLNGQEIDWVV